MAQTVHYSHLVSQPEEGQGRKGHGGILPHLKSATCNILLMQRKVSFFCQLKLIQSAQSLQHCG